MEQKDYLLRYLDQLAIVLARLLGLKQEGKVSEAWETVDKALVGMKLPNLDKLSQLGRHDILDTLQRDLHLENVQLEVVAELLYQTGELQMEQNQKAKAKDLFRKALDLFDHVSLEEKIYSFEREAKTARMSEFLSGS